MTRTRAVLLAFAGMALVLVSSTVVFVWSFVDQLAVPPPDPAELTAVNQVFDAKTKTFDPIRGIDRVLPIGMAWSAAAAKLAESKFDCKNSTTGRRCDRDARRGPCRLERHIAIGLTDALKISSISATETPICL